MALINKGITINQKTFVKGYLPKGYKDKVEIFKDSDHEIDLTYCVETELIRDNNELNQFFDLLHELENKATSELKSLYDVKNKDFNFYTEVLKIEPLVKHKGETIIYTCYIKIYVKNT